MSIEAMKAIQMVYANTTKHDWPDDIWDAICQAIKAEKHEVSQEPVAYTTGHCKEKAKAGGCQLHNIQCGFPDCDRKLT